MPIYREGSEIRVERSEKTARLTALAGSAAALYVAGYGATKSDDLAGWLLVVAVLLFGAGLSFVALRQRHVVIIRPDQIAAGHIGRDLAWYDRSEIESVEIAINVLLQLRFYDTQGQLRQAVVLSHFDKNELREAFEEAGIPLR